MTPEEMRDLPKAEVHVHLEGCFEPDEIVALAGAAGEPLPRPREKLLAFEDLAGLLEFLDWSCGLVRTPDQLARAAYRFAQREAASGALYADVIVNPAHWPRWRDRLDAFVAALHAGFCEAEQDGLPPVGLCVSILRRQSASEAIELAEWIIGARHHRIVALSIDGDEAEAGRTAPRFAEAFRRVAERGLHRTAHAGESSGPQGVCDAIALLGVERIDHGIRAVEDDALVRELAASGIPLGLCPWSNVLLGLYPDRTSHPLDRLRRAGVRVSVNTDDPALTGCGLEDEYSACAETFGWGRDVVAGVARTSIEASFCEEDLRSEMVHALEAWEESAQRSSRK